MGKRGPAKGTGGRPTSPIDWDHIDELASIFCTCDEIATVTRIHINTLNNICKKTHGVTIGDYCDEKKNIGRRNLRRVQMASAMKGNIVMQIWLGKQLLNQTDRIETIDKSWAEKKSRAELVALGKEALGVIEKSLEKERKLDAQKDADRKELAESRANNVKD